MIAQAPEIAGLAKQYTDLRAEYVVSRRTDRSPPVSGRQVAGTAADKSFSSEYAYHLAAEQANQLDENDLLVGSGIDRFVVNILQAGFGVDPETGDPEIDAIIREKWGTEDSEEGWTNSPDQCDIRQQFDFNFNTFLALRGSIIRGDIFGLPLKSGHIQLIENYRCRTPRGAHNGGSTVFGVEVDSNRMPVRYWFTNDDIAIDKPVDVRDSRAINARDANGELQVYHLLHPKRITGTRGVTKTAPLQRAAGMHNDIQESRLKQQQALSRMLLVRERDHAFELPDGVTETGVYQLPDPCRSGETREVQDLADLSIYTTYNGESMKVLSGNVPTSAQLDHAMQMIQLIAMNLDMPMGMFLMDASQTNFSGWRGSMDQARIKFRHFQRWLKNSWHRPIYLWKLRQWSNPSSPLADPRLVAARERLPAFLNHRWTFPAWPYINPTEDVAVDATEIRNGLNSPRRVQKRHAREWPIIAEEIVQDHSIIIEKAIAEADRINQHPFIIANPDQKVGWREICNRSLPEGTQANLTPQPPQQSDGNAINAQ